MAKILFTREKLDQKIVAKKVGVSEKTMSKWVTEFNWKKLRARLLATKEQILNDLYEELDRLQTAINTRPKEQGNNWATSSEADVRIKTTASIRNLETDLGIGDMVESGIRFVKFLQLTGTMDQVMEFAELWNAFLLQSLKKS